MNEDLSKTAFKCSAQGPLEVADFAPQKHRGLRGLVHIRTAIQKGLNFVI